MLRSGDDDLILIAIADPEYPGTAPLSKHRPGLTVEPVVRHALLGTRFADDMDLLAGLKPLDKGCDREDSPSSYVFL